MVNHIGDDESGFVSTPQDNASFVKHFSRGRAPLHFCLTFLLVVDRCIAILEGILLHFVYCDDDVCGLCRLFTL